MGGCGGRRDRGGGTVEVTSGRPRACAPQRPQRRGPAPAQPRCGQALRGHSRPRPSDTAALGAASRTRSQPHRAGAPSHPTVNAAAGCGNGKTPEPEGCAEAAAGLGLAPNVNTPDGLVLVKLKLVVLPLPNWKTEPAVVKAEKLHDGQEGSFSSEDSDLYVQKRGKD